MQVVMAFSFLQMICFLALSYYIYSWISWAISERRFKKFAAANGCSPPYRIPNRLPWGIERLLNLYTFIKEGKDILDDLISPGQEASGYTLDSVGIGGTFMVVTSEPENFKAVLATKFKDFEQGSMRHAQFGPLLGKSILNSDGPFWEHSRAVLRPQFARDQINDLSDTERSTQILMQALPVGADGWAEADVSKLFFKFTLDTGTAFLFGKSVDSLKGSIPGVVEAAQTDAERMALGQGKEEFTFEEAVGTANTFLTARIRLPVLYIFADSPRFRRSVAYIRRFVGGYVEAALQGRSAGQSKKYDLSTSLTQSIPDKDPVEIRDQLLSAALLAWLFIELSRRPEVYRKLRQTIVDEFGTGASQVNFESIKNATYLQHCLRETLRAWPVVPLNSRIAVRDTVLPRGGGPDRSRPVAVRKGTTVLMPVYTMHRRKDLWGPDADEWRPERWEGRKQDWTWVPFSGGPRVCLGQQYALTEAAYLAIRLLQRYDRLEWNGPPGAVKKGIGLTLVPADGVNVRLHQAQDYWTPDLTASFAAATAGKNIHPLPVSNH